MKHINFKKTILAGFLFLQAFAIFGCEKEIFEQETLPLKAGVFGGSLSVYPESETAKKIWKDNLNITVTSLGVEGAGFSSLTLNNVPTQIERAEAFDVYILWCSTNDIFHSIGDTDSDDITTQNGGILKSIELIKQKNDRALILLFTSLPCFTNDEYYNKMPSFVDGQIAVCLKNHIPYLDQLRLSGFDKSNFTPYYRADKMHLTSVGYEHIGEMQMEFIRENIEKYLNTVITDLPAVVSRLKIQTNPVAENLAFEINVLNSQNIEIQIINTSGKEFFMGKDFASQGKFVKTIPAGELTKGTYLLVVQAKEWKLTKKFLKE